MIKVGSIIEILNHAAGYGELYEQLYPVGSRYEVLRWHPETGEVEIHYANDPDDEQWHTFFPGEYKLVE